MLVNRRRGGEPSDEHQMVDDIAEAGREDDETFVGVDGALAARVDSIAIHSRPHAAMVPVTSHPLPSAASGRRPAFARSVALTYGSNVGAAALSLASVLITSRALGPEGRGEVALLTTIAYLSS